MTTLLFLLPALRAKAARLQREDGATAWEYILIIAILGAFLIGIFYAFGGSLQGLYNMTLGNVFGAVGSAQNGGSVNTGGAQTF
jgi:Flp pilus assembly pilin Flp